MRSTYTRVNTVIKALATSNLQLTTHNFSLCTGLTPPEVLLNSHRRQAREFTSIGDERAVSERVRCVALSRILHGDNHWKLAKALSRLSQVYLEQGGQCNVLLNA